MNKDPVLIGVHGLKGTGKDLAARMFTKYLAHSETFAFGDKVKFMCHIAHNVPLIRFYDETSKEIQDIEIDGKKYSPRDLMKATSDLYKAQFGADFFAVEILHVWEKARQERCAISLVASDVRFEEEAQVIRLMGGTIVHLQGPDRVGYEKASNHNSEQGIAFCEGDLKLYNTGDLQALLEGVRTLLVQISPETLADYPYLPDNESIAREFQIDINVKDRPMYIPV